MYCDKHGTCDIGMAPHDCEKSIVHITGVPMIGEMDMTIHICNKCGQKARYDYFPANSISWTKLRKDHDVTKFLG